MVYVVTSFLSVVYIVTIYIQCCHLHTQMAYTYTVAITEEAYPHNFFCSASLIIWHYLQISYYENETK